VVTLPGSPAPRQVYVGLYGEIDLDCCIARSADEYVEIALRLGRDAQYRGRCPEQISARCARLFDRSDAGLASGKSCCASPGLQADASFAFAASRRASRSCSSCRCSCSPAYRVGKPVDILVNPQSDQNEIARATAALGLDRPLLEQYFVFVGHAATGDLGRILRLHVPRSADLERVPATLELATAGC